MKWYIYVLCRFGITQSLSIGTGRQKRSNAQSRIEKIKPFLKQQTVSLKPNWLALACSIFGSRIHWFWLISFLIFQGKPEFNITLQRLREHSVGAAQVVHTFAHLKGVFVHDDSLLTLRKKDVPYEGEYFSYSCPSCKCLSLAVHTIQRRARDFKLAYIQHIFQTTYI